MNTAPPRDFSTETDDFLLGLERFDAEELLRYAFETYGDRAAIGTSLQKTGIVAIDLVHRLGIPYRVFFLDTRANHPETYELLEEVESRYGISIERFAPTDEELEGLHREFGAYPHYLARSRCCHARKGLPMERALATMDVWLAGLRMDQSEHRRATGAKVGWAYDLGRRVLKINPLFDWTSDEIDEYTREHGLPYNKLYDYVSPYNERYTTIGCEPCHIPIQECLDARAGKFPWEQGRKECGLHQDGLGI